ncbi:MAG: hypothetical protein PHS96_14075, partial [Anaerolineales bacterium]|nr:hypothetical protein [Anaerolineales bacterium]
MNARTYALLFLLNLGVVALVTSFQGAPGYMDAEYNYAGGLQLVAGRGFSEPFLWNYLDDPVGLPHASHAYWMPLGSILAAAGMWLSGATSFANARAGFILLAAGIAPVTAGLAFELSRRRNLALSAGILAAFPGYYLAYLGTSDVFGVVMLLGAAYLLIAGGLQPRGNGEQAGSRAGWRLFGLGLISGLMHLSRPDGGVWFLLSLGLMCTGFTKRGSWRQNLGDLLRGSVLVVLGYLLVMGPWLGRNTIAFGAPFSASSLRSLWLTSYDELYAFPATMLTYERWAGAGLGAILRARAGAFGQNLLTAFAVQGLIFLFPLTIAGAWALRRDWRVRLGAAAWVATLLLMSVVFPYSGARGGFFHSGAATQSLWWALSVVGLEGFVQWGARRRGWQVERGRRTFCAGAVLLAMVLTARLAWTRVIG